MTDLILYTTEDGRSQIERRAQEWTVWLTQLEMAKLFDATKQNISPHLNNVFEDGELDADSVVKERWTVQQPVGKCDSFAQNERVKRRATHNIATSATKDTPWS